MKKAGKFELPTLFQKNIATCRSTVALVAAASRVVCWDYRMRQCGDLVFNAIGFALVAAADYRSVDRRRSAVFYTVSVKIADVYCEVYRVKRRMSNFCTWHQPCCNFAEISLFHSIIFLLLGSVATLLRTLRGGSIFVWRYAVTQPWTLCDSLMFTATVIGNVSTRFGINVPWCIEWLFLAMNTVLCPPISVTYTWVVDSILTLLLSAIFLSQCAIWSIYDVRIQYVALHC